ncbi:MAG: hypothetical protein H6509_16290 [Bryobacterales bacterium]|nr:hypothetical protein [Bryobacterales bacterium]
MLEVEEQRGPRDFGPAPLAGLDGYQVLVVEDQMMIALNTQRMLDELGADKVETAATTAERCGCSRSLSIHWRCST